jgi:predicted transcriptional regulator
MKKTEDYLLLVSQKFHLENGNQLANLIGVPRQAITQYKKGHDLSTKTAIVVAHLLGIAPMEIICAIMYNQAKTEKEKEFWEFWHKRHAENVIGDASTIDDADREAMLKLLLSSPDQDNET